MKLFGVQITSPRGELWKLAKLGLDINFKAARTLDGGRREVPAILTERQIQQVRDAGFEVGAATDLTAEAGARLREVTRGNRFTAAPEEAARARVLPQYEGYMNTEEVETAMTVLPGLYPGIATVIKLPNPTAEGQTSHALHLRAGTKKNRHGILFLGSMHAREWGGSDICVNFAHQLLLAYKNSAPLVFRDPDAASGGKVYAPAQVRAILENLDVFVFPDVNPDGKRYSQSADTGPDQRNWWRKNRNPNTDKPDPGDPELSKIGVDNNRNFDFLWERGINASPNAHTPEYKGGDKMSEAETRNVAHLLKTYKNIRYLVDLHSGGGPKILHSWGDDDSQIEDYQMNWNSTVDENGRPIDPLWRGLTREWDGGRPDDVPKYREFVSTLDKNTIRSWTKRMREALKDVRGRDYTVMPAAEDKPTSGSGMDWAFSRDDVRRVYGVVVEFGESGVYVAPYQEMRKIIEDAGALMAEFCWSVLSDLFMRDNVKDTGEVPARGQFWNSPDIWVRNAKDNGKEHQKPVRGRSNYVYVRVKNRGLAEAKHVCVRVYVSRWAGTQFTYPYYFVAENPDGGGSISATPRPKKPNTYLVGEAEIEEIKKGEEVITSVEWKPQLIPPAKNWHPCLLVEVAPNDGPTATGRGVWDNNNLAQKNVTIVDAKPGASVSFTFQVGTEVGEPVAAATQARPAAAASRARGAATRRGAVQPEMGALVVNKLKGPRKLEMFLDVQDDAMMRTLKRDARGAAKASAQPASRRKAGLKAGAKSAAAAARGEAITGFGFADSRGKSVLALAGRRQGKIPLRLKEREAKKMTLKVAVPKDAGAGEQYEMEVVQRDARGRAVGGVVLEVNVVKTVKKKK